MGAVFSIYAGFYYWIPKILGVPPFNLYSTWHFWALILGVNVTFIPQHFLGIQGIPRRIPDYADAYTGWNFTSSIGSIVSLGATVIFLYVLYKLTLNTILRVLNLWITVSFFSDFAEFSKSVSSFITLEGVVQSPTPEHPYRIIPVQS